MVASSWMNASRLPNSSKLIVSSFSRVSRIRSRASKSGISTRSRFGSLLSTASSRSCGRLVAARMMSRSVSVDLRPSHAAMNSFLIRLVASWSMDSRRLSSPSTSSKNSTTGTMDRATWNRALTRFSDSPNHFEVRVDARISRKLAPDSAATALARRVLPVPGGPKRSTPFVAFFRLPRVNRCGCLRGSATSSRSACFCSESAPMSENLTCRSPGATTDWSISWYISSSSSLSSSSRTNPDSYCVTGSGLWISLRCSIASCSNEESRLSKFKFPAGKVREMGRRSELRFLPRFCESVSLGLPPAEPSPTEEVSGLDEVEVVSGRETVEGLVVVVW
mmetsp:Transcript_774/g.1364  ORF Transcript_774/g.1364 Transcript_774/m.1364 type:complete len:335 (+) Transcript_774:655-1659(+)